MALACLGELVCVSIPAEFSRSQIPFGNAPSFSDTAGSHAEPTPAPVVAPQPKRSFPDYVPNATKSHEMLDNAGAFAYIPS